MVVNGSESDGYFGDFGSAVVGSATNPSVLGDFTSKSYDGVFVAEFNPQQYADGLRSGRADRHRLTGDLQFTANFESNNISANVSNIEERVYSQQENISSGNNIIGSLNLTAGNIVGNTFSGAVSAESALLTSLNATSLTGQYNGKFFGPDAEEVGGVLSGTTIEDSGNRNFIGMFKGATSE